jgi:AAA15 family ATPase/GTPase
MLAAFRFDNFRSFSGEAELSLVAHGSDNTLRSALLKIPGRGRRLNLLPVAAIYGSNAAGKTNVLAAFEYVRRAVSRSQTSWAPSGGTEVEPHLGRSNDPSSFEVDIYLEGARYQYGFAATPHYFVDEWLYSYPKGRKRVIFKRETNKEGVVNVLFGPSLVGDDRFIESTIRRTRPNSLFLSASAQDNNPISVEVVKFFKQCFTTSLYENIDPMLNLTGSLYSIKSIADIILSLVQYADSSVNDIEIRPRGKTWSQSSEEERNSFFFGVGRQFDIDFVYGDGDELFRVPFDQQSRGVKKIFAIAGEIASCFLRKRILLLDEIESSIHPHVARFIVDLFQDSDVNGEGSQVVFTTHDTGLLDQTLLRRDQIWFVEKDACCSRLYSLLDFSPRKDADLELGYLRGRYGAIPVARPRADWIAQTRSLAEISNELPEI